MNPVGWFEIYIDNIARAKSFYEALFQLTLETLGDPTDDT
jgi:predicted enzyme related to lactoylglutathione lyase